MLADDYSYHYNYDHPRVFINIIIIIIIIVRMHKRIEIHLCFWSYLVTSDGTLVYLVLLGYSLQC